MTARRDFLPRHRPWRSAIGPRARNMRRLRTYLLALLVAIPVCSAKDWTKLTSDNFELYTTASEGAGKRAIEYFERVRAFFIDAIGMRPVSANKVRLVAFSSEKEYKPYKPSEFAFAYYLPAADRDYIILQSIDERLFEAAVHEYVHLLVKDSGMKVPVWFNEGLADLYSNLKPVGNIIQVGHILSSGRAQSLWRYKWLPLEKLFAVTHTSPEYNEKYRATIFYAQSWALTHMIMLSPDYNKRSGAFTAELAAGKPAAEALETIYGKSLDQVRKDLEGYTRRDTIYVARFAAKLLKSVANIEVGPAPPAAAQLVLAQVLSYMRKNTEAIEMVRSLAGQYPDSAEVREALGYFQMHKDPGMAIEEFSKAASLGSRNARMYRDLAYLLRSQGAEGRPLAIEALLKSLEIEPAYLDARLNLASLHLEEDKYGEALSHLAKVSRVTTERAWWYFRTLAYCQLQLNAPEEARKAAVRAQSFADSEKRKADAEQLLRHIDTVLRNPGVRGASRPTAVPDPDSEADRPTIRRREAQPPAGGNSPAAPPAEALAYVTGRLELLECRDPRAVLYIRDGSGNKVTLEIHDPAKVQVEAKGSGAVELNCGPQSAAVTVAYRPGSGQGSPGPVVSITFE